MKEGIIVNPFFGLDDNRLLPGIRSIDRRTNGELNKFFGGAYELFGQ